MTSLHWHRNLQTFGTRSRSSAPWYVWPTPWRAEQFLSVFQNVVRVLDEVDPDIVAVDNFFGPGITACHNLGREWIVLSPNTLLDYVISRQPNAAGMWRYPR
jgi:hypothetical protein